MRRFLPILLVFLALVSPCQGFKQSNEIADVTYALRCWPTGLSVADQIFTNGQVIDTPAEGCLDGSLTIAGTISSCQSSKLKIAVTGTGTCWSAGGIGTGISKTLGLAIFSTVNQANGTTPAAVWGFYKSSTFSATQASSCWQTLNTSVYPSWQYSAPGWVEFSGALAYGTDYKNVLVLGGYNSSGVPYKSGDIAANYKYGASYFWKGGSYTNWTLLWRDSVNNDSTLYPVLSQCSGTGGTATTHSNSLVPNYDFSAVLQPTHLSLFATDGELSAYTPDVGSVWTESSGDWDTSSGKVVNTMAGIATFDPSLTTGMYDVTVTMPASGTTAGGLVARYTDSSNYWYVALSVGSSNNVVLNEDSGGSVTSRSTASATLNASTAYAVRLIVSSTSPYWTTYIAGVAKNSYATVGSQSTSTKFGLYDGGDINMTGFDVVGFWPLTSATYTSEFAKVGY